MCPFDYMDVAVSGKVGRPLTGLTTPIAWMLSVISAIDRPKSVPQTAVLSKVHFFLSIYIFNIFRSPCYLNMFR